ncbi:MAG: DNA polymerase Y family protein [Ideonella sp.]
MLWIGLHLPLLSLETVACLPGFGGDASVAGPAGADVALAIVDAHHIVHVNQAGQALGVRPAMKRATALALAPQLVLAQADAARDALALQAVGHAALTFTPMVCLLMPGATSKTTAQTAPQTVLLEVQASLRYFRGFESLLQRLKAALQPLGHRLQIASAPTAQAATLLCRLAARNRDGELHCADLAQTMRCLDAAPVGLLAAAAEHLDALEAIGLRQIGELRRLPRAGLARRFGQALLDEIDRAFGRCPDPRQPISLPPQFSSRLELLARADSTEQVLYGARVLLNRLVVWALAHQARVGRFSLQMLHETRHRSDAQTPPASELEIALTEASCDADHLQLLLRERLAQVRLAAPTLELRLSCPELVHRPPPNGELFPTARNEKEGLTRLIERLQARLGGAQVQRLVRVEDHRPERASITQPFDGQWAASSRQRSTAPVDGGVGVPLQQPVWLMLQPEPLIERQRQPLLDGRPLQLLCGPERIETGWWDAALAERDYFIAQAGDGSLVWIYRGRLPPREAVETDGAVVPAVDRQSGWFLHGRFA